MSWKQVRCACLHWVPEARTQICSQDEVSLWGKLQTTHCKQLRGASAGFLGFSGHSWACGWETWGQGLLTACRWPGAAAGHGTGGTVHPACRWSRTLSGGAGQPLPQSLRAAFCGHSPSDHSWGIRSVCLGGAGLLLWIT